MDERPHLVRSVMLSYHVEREHGRLSSALSPEPTPSTVALIYISTTSPPLNIVSVGIKF